MLLFSDEDLRAVIMNVNLVVTQGVTMGVGGVLYMALLLICFFKKEGSRLYGFLVVLDNFLILYLAMKLYEGTTWSADGPLICAILISVLLLLNYIVSIIACCCEMFNCFGVLQSAMTSFILTTILILGVTCEYKQ